VSGKAGAESDSEFGCSISSSSFSYLSSFLTPKGGWLTILIQIHTYRQIDLSAPKMVVVMVKV
jgi:hypothetical protein